MPLTPELLTNPYATQYWREETMKNYIVTLNWEADSESILDAGGYQEMILAASNPYAAMGIALTNFQPDLERCKKLSVSCRPANVVSTV